MSIATWLARPASAGSWRSAARTSSAAREKAACWWPAESGRARGREGAPISGPAAPPAVGVALARPAARRVDGGRSRTDGWGGRAVGRERPGRRDPRVGAGVALGLGLAGDDLDRAVVRDHLAHRIGRAPAEGLTRSRIAEAEEAGGREIVGEALALRLGGRVDEPHQEEEGHHRGDEIGVGDLPGAAVGGAFDRFLAADDDAGALVVAAAPLLALRAHPPAVLLSGGSVAEVA